MGNLEIVAISKQYKDTLNDLINSSDLEFLDQAKPIDEKFWNTLISESSSPDLLKKNCLGEHLLNRSLWLVLKIQNS